MLPVKHLMIVPLLLALAACAARPEPDLKLRYALDSLDAAVLQGRKVPESTISSYDALYKKYHSRPIAVAAYVDALRRVGKARQAADILKPYIERNPTKKVPGPIFMAYARLLIDQNYFREAEKRLRERLTMPASKMTGATSTAQVTNLLGVALASQGRKDEAEQAFNVALAQWNGKPGVIEQNLAQLRQ